MGMVRALAGDPIVDGGSRRGRSDGIGFARGGNFKIKGRRASKPPEQPGLMQRMRALC